MKRTFKCAIALSLVLVLLWSLCACAKPPQPEAASTEAEKNPVAASLPTATDKIKPEKPPVEPAAPEPPPEEPDVPPEPAGFSEEAAQSLAWLRERMNMPHVMFGAAFLGYVGETSEADSAMVQKYPFIPEIDAEHTIPGTDEYLFCLVPMDENAAVSVNLVQWPPESDGEEILEVLYRSESGDPVLFFADCGADATAYDSYIQVQIVDNAGNSCLWYPQLDAMGRIVACLSESGDYRSFDFTEYGWRGAPPELASRLAEGWTKIYASGLEGSWNTSTVEDTGRTIHYDLMLYLEDETGGAADLSWYYEDSDDLEAMWMGTWTVLNDITDSPAYIYLDLSLSGDGLYCFSETYPFLVSPAGTELVLGIGLQGIPLPFMTDGQMQPYELTWDFELIAG